MGSYTKGVYVPSIGETGWGEEINDFLTRSGEEYVNVKAAPYGAAGDGTTDDSAEIQAAIDTGAGVIYFPPGRYRIGTTLVPRSGQHYLGAGSTAQYGEASTLICSGANPSMWNINGITRATWDRLDFEDSLGVATYGVGQDTVFRQTSGATPANLWTHCNFWFVKWAFYMDGGDWLTNRLFYCNFRDSPSYIVSGSFINNNGFEMCTWNPCEKDVPAIEMGNGGNSAYLQENYFHGCYFETCKYQAIKCSGASGFQVSDTYFEAINYSQTTYTDFDGNTRLLPYLDFTNPVTGGSQPSAKNVFVGPNYYIDANGNSVIVGTSVFSGGRNIDLTFHSPNAYLADFSGFTTVRVPTPTLPAEENFYNTFFGPHHRRTVTPTGVAPAVAYAPDMSVSDTWVINAQSDGAHNAATITVANPLNAYDGAVITLLVWQWNTGTVTLMSSLTLGSKFTLVNGAITKPASAKHMSIRFRYFRHLDKWIEQSRTGDF